MNYVGAVNIVGFYYYSLQRRSGAEGTGKLYYYNCFNSDAVDRIIWHVKAHYCDPPVPVLWKAGLPQEKWVLTLNLGGKGL